MDTVQALSVINCDRAGAGRSFLQLQLPDRIYEHHLYVSFRWLGSAPFDIKPIVPVFLSSIAFGFKSLSAFVLYA